MRIESIIKSCFISRFILQSFILFVSESYLLYASKHSIQFNSFDYEKQKRNEWNKNQSGVLYYSKINRNQIDKRNEKHWKQKRVIGRSKLFNYLIHIFDIHSYQYLIISGSCFIFSYCYLFCVFHVHQSSYGCVDNDVYNDYIYIAEKRGVRNNSILCESADQTHQK